MVEDELDALDLITIDLAEHGATGAWRVFSDRSSQLLNPDQFDLLISDIGMADTDGYKLIRQVRKSGR